MHKNIDTNVHSYTVYSYIIVYNDWPVCYDENSKCSQLVSEQHLDNAVLSSPQSAST